MISILGLATGAQNLRMGLVSQIFSKLRMYAWMYLDWDRIPGPLLVWYCISASGWRSMACLVMGLLEPSPKIYFINSALTGIEEMKIGKEQNTRHQTQSRWQRTKTQLLSTLEEFEDWNEKVCSNSFALLNSYMVLHKSVGPLSLSFSSYRIVSIISIPYRCC